MSEGGRGYTRIRRLRRDGNCFYRSFLFQLFEYYANHLAPNSPDKAATKVQYEKFIAIIEASKKDLVDNAGYDEIVIEDFYDVFLE